MTRGRDDADEAEVEETSEDRRADEAPVPSDEDLRALVNEEGGKWICGGRDRGEINRAGDRQRRRCDGCHLRRRSGCCRL
jgi:hypothetical protein